jgi:flagellar basal-body rod modification protein FlgD
VALKQNLVKGKERRIMELPNVGVIGTQGQQNPNGRDAFSELNLDDFLKLLITELQNQDPMEPMKNAELLQQLSQIREIESNMRLTETLESVRLGQNLTVANGMLGRSIVALTDDAKEVTGQVDRISIVDGQPKLRVGEYTVDLQNVSQILDPSTGA